MVDRPRTLVVVAGTGTEVGKTWVGAELLRRAVGAGLRVAARKPAQSFTPGAGPTDAEFLAAASGERPEEVCPPHRSYEVPMAPFMAAARLGRPPFTLQDVLAELAWPGGVDLGVVEGAGGVRSPITADAADTVDLADALRPDHVVLVADAGLGTINAVRLCLDALRSHRSLLVLNRYEESDELHRANRDWLVHHVEVPVVADVSDLFVLVTEK